MGLGRTTTAGHRPLEALYTLADRIRDEATPSDLLRIEEDIDAILKLHHQQNNFGSITVRNDEPKKNWKFSVADIQEEVLEALHNCL
jgi:hypothetical protein